MAEESRGQHAGDNAHAHDHNQEGGTEAPQHGTVLRERRSDEAPNPKKRMWVENTNADTDSAQPARDEL